MVPSVNTVLEPDFYSVLPPSVTLHSHRLWAPPSVWAAPGSDAAEAEGPVHLRAMNDDIETALRYLMTAAVDIVVYGCTSGSFTWGYGGQAEIANRIEESSGRPAVVTTGAIVDALRAYRVRRISVVSPYPEATNRRLRDFLIAGGHDLLAIRADPKARSGSRAMAAEEPREIFEFALANCAAGSELLMVPCTAWRSFEVAADLEQQLGIPVVTANQATIWAALAHLGVASQVSGHGSLFTQPLPNPEGGRAGRSA